MKKLTITFLILIMAVVAAPASVQAETAPLLFSIPSDEILVPNPRSLEVDSNGNVLVVTASGLMKLDPQGNELWKKFIGANDMALDSLNNIYSVGLNQPRVEKFDPDGNLLMSFGTFGSGEGQFRSPEGIALDPTGNIYVADRGNDRIQKFDSNGNFLEEFGTTGTEFGQFQNPALIDVDVFGNIYVVERGTAGSGRLQQFDQDWNFIRWGSASGGTPAMVVDSQNNVYLSGGDSVRKTGPRQGRITFRTVQTIGSRGSEEGEFISTWGIALDSIGNIYVSDFGNDRIQIFDPLGNFLKQFGTIGSSEGRFNEPQGIDVDNVGNIYVADTGNDRIQKFDSSGNFLNTFGSRCLLSSGTDCVDPDGSGPLELGDGQFKSPNGIAIDSLGNSYIVDSGNDRIQKFDQFGNFLMKFGSSCDIDSGFGCVDPDGSGPLELGDGQFGFPTDITVDSTGNIFVADLDQNRIQKFDSFGTFVSKWGTFCNLGSGFGCVDPDGSGPLELGDGQFDSPSALAVDKSDNIYAVDKGSVRIQKFNSSGEFLFKFGNASFLFLRFESVAVGDDGNIYVGDAIARVHKFDSTGNSILDFNGSGEGEFDDPQSLAIDGSNNVYLTDTSNHRVLVFGPAIPDTDGDTIPNEFDICPNDPEDLDGFQDADGCPDFDNDNDTIPDDFDACPNEPDNFLVNDDGCPDPEPKFAITIVDDPDPVQIGDVLTYTLEISNASGAGNILFPTLIAALPAEVTFVSASSADGTCLHVSFAGNIVQCHWDDFAGGTIRLVTIQVDIETADIPEIELSARVGFGSTTVEVIEETSVSVVPANDSDSDGVHDGEDTCPGTTPGASVDVNGCSQEQSHELLAERFRPILYFDENERFRPQEVQVVFDNARLRKNGALVQGAPDPLTPEFLAMKTDSEYRLDLDDSILESVGLSEDYSNTAYVHIVEDQDHVVLQYWFFYYFNDWQGAPIGDSTHEGDWEFIQVVFPKGKTVAELINQNLEPKQAVYSAHLGGYEATWENIEKESGRPVVYVAHGSHANHFKQGVCDLEFGILPPEFNIIGIGIDEVQKTTRLEPIGSQTILSSDIDGAFGWLLFEGKWGEHDTNFRRSPSGPLTQITKWTTPIAWTESTALSWVSYYDERCDGDFDGIWNNVDTQPGDPSDAFDAPGLLGRKTEGTITERGDREFKIKDAEIGGVHFEVGPGKETSVIELNGSFCLPDSIMTFEPSTEITFGTATCLSSEVSVEEGIVEFAVSHNGFEVVTTVAAHQTVLYDVVDDQLKIETSGEGEIPFTINGKSVTVQAGETFFVHDVLEGEANISARLKALRLETPPTGATPPGGIYSITSTFEYTGFVTIDNLIFEVTIVEFLDGGVPSPELDNRDANSPAGVGARLTVPLPGGVLNPGDIFDVVFEIWLPRIAVFRASVEAFTAQ